MNFIKTVILVPMEINEYEAGMLDTILIAFAGKDELNWTELIELFDGDEELAAAITDILAGSELIVKIGEESAIGLPEKIIQTDKTLSFIKNGGFTAQVNGAFPPTIEEPESREMIFEIENNITNQPEEIPAEGATNEEFTPVSTSMLLSAEPKSASEVLLEQEIAHLRHEQRRSEHRLREKDIVIQALNTHIETLGRFRIFIWVLLGIIAVLTTMLIFHKH